MSNTPMKPYEDHKHKGDIGRGGNQKVGDVEVEYEGRILVARVLLRGLVGDRGAHCRVGSALRKNSCRLEEGSAHGGQTRRSGTEAKEEDLGSQREVEKISKVLCMPENPFEDARCIPLHLMTHEQVNKFILRQRLQNRASSSLGYRASLLHKSSTFGNHKCDRMVRDIRVFSLPHVLHRSHSWFPFHHSIRPEK